MDFREKVSYSGWFYRLALQDTHRKIGGVGPVSDADTGHRDARGHLNYCKECVKTAKGACSNRDANNRFICQGCNNAGECRRESCHRNEYPCLRTLYICCELFRIPVRGEYLKVIGYALFLEYPCCFSYNFFI